MADPQTAGTWAKLVSDYGLAIVGIVVLMGFGLTVLVVFWKFLRPKLDRLFELLFDVINKQSEFVEQVRDILPEQSKLISSLGTAIQDGHEKTHQKLDAIHGDIKDLPGKIHKRSQG